MSLLKFFERDNPHDESYGGRLGWIGNEQLPPLLDTSLPALTQTQLESLETHGQFKRRKFCLWIPEDLVAYVEVNDKAINGLYDVLYKELHESAEHGEQYAYVEWMQKYSALPPTGGFADPGERPVHSIQGSR